MRETHNPNFRRRYYRMVPLGLCLLVGGFVLYGFLGSGWWMYLYFPVLAAVGIYAAWTQSSVRCPHCGRLVNEQEHHDPDRQMVFICRSCDARISTDVISGPGGWRRGLTNRRRS